MDWSAEKVKVPNMKEPTNRECSSKTVETNTAVALENVREWCASENSSQGIIAGSVDDDVVNKESKKESNQKNIPDGTELKYLEVQANLKHMVQNLQSQCHYLQTMVNQRDETILDFDKMKNLKENEYQLLKRELELAIKEKENAVIKYCTLEKKIIDADLVKEFSEKKIREAQKECDLLTSKLKMLSADKNRISTLFDQKCHEFRSQQKEIERLKDENINLESKVKWGSGKVKQESDLRQTAEKKIEELTEELNAMKSNIIATVKNEIDSERLSQMEKQYMEQQASLILLKHGNEEKEIKIEGMLKKIHGFQIEISEVGSKYSAILQEKEFFEKDNKKLRNDITEIQNMLDEEILRLADYQSKLNDLEATKAQLTIERENSIRQAREYEIQQKTLEENLIELEHIRVRESELLQFNKVLTERNVKLQNEITLYNSKAVALCLENEMIKKEKKTYDDKIIELEQLLEKERIGDNNERILLMKNSQCFQNNLEEMTKLYDTTQKKLDSALGDLDAVKNKHAQALKGLNRELEKLRRRQQMNSFEKESSPQVSDTDSQGSQRMSKSDSNNSSLTNSEQKPSTQSLIDRILRLQQANARQSEKIDFLESHSATLVAEVQKKTKVLQHYMLREQCGALASSKSDRHKAEMAKYGGGIMAAIYGGTTSAEMTFDLSLEINRKLQALLEDTLLKNITLKENLDTLGLEVDKLTRKLAAK